MPRSGLEQIAESTILRVIATFESLGSLEDALARAYPFGSHPEGREVWKETLRRHAGAIEAAKKSGYFGQSRRRAGLSPNINVRIKYGGRSFY